MKILFHKKKFEKKEKKKKRERIKMTIILRKLYVSMKSHIRLKKELILRPML
jgi:hypothetical protein